MKSLSLFPSYAYNTEKSNFYPRNKLYHRHLISTVNTPWQHPNIKKIIIFFLDYKVIKSMIYWILVPLNDFNELFTVQSIWCPALAPTAAPVWKKFKSHFSFRLKRIRWMWILSVYLPQNSSEMETHCTKSSSSQALRAEKHHLKKK